MIIICYIIPVFIMFASTFKRTHWLALGDDDSSPAKIGVIQVSCSCGKWSPIDADEPQTASAFNHQKPFVVLIGQNGLVLHILYFAWKFCIKLVPHQLTVILGLVSTRTIFWEIYPRKAGRDNLGIRARLTIG
jgi:hypothetical protein